MLGDVCVYLFIYLVICVLLPILFRESSVGLPSVMVFLTIYLSPLTRSYVFTEMFAGIMFAASVAMARFHCGRHTDNANRQPSVGRVCL